MVSTIGPMSGAIGPALLGIIRTATDNFNAGAFLLSGILVLSAALMLAVVTKSDERPSTEGVS